MNGGGDNRDADAAEKERQQYWYFFVDKGTSFVISASTLVTGFSFGKETTKSSYPTALAISVTTTIGFLCFLSAHFFDVGSVPYCLFASLGASSKLMLAVFVAVHIYFPSFKFWWIPCVFSGVATLAGFLFLSRDSATKNFGKYGGIAVGEVKRGCGLLGGCMKACFGAVGGRMKACFGAVGGRMKTCFGAVGGCMKACFGAVGGCMKTCFGAVFDACCGTCFACVQSFWVVPNDTQEMQLVNLGGEHDHNV